MGAAPAAPMARSAVRDFLDSRSAGGLAKGPPSQKRPLLQGGDARRTGRRERARWLDGVGCPRLRPVIPRDPDRDEQLSFRGIVDVVYRVTLRAVGRARPEPEPPGRESDPEAAGAVGADRDLGRRRRADLDPNERAARRPTVGPCDPSAARHWPGHSTGGGEDAGASASTHFRTCSTTSGRMHGAEFT